MTWNERYTKILQWRERSIPNDRFILLLSFIVGIFTSLAASLLKGLIHLIQYLLTLNFSINEVHYLYLLYPSVGIVLALLFVKYVVKDDISHGVTKILFAISQRKSIIKPHNMWSSIIASAFTIGFGGSVGAEAPVVLTGSAIGSNLGRAFKLDQKTLMLMVGCGAAGAIGGIFKAPIAGIVFTLEVLMLDMTFSSVIPLLISSVTATTIAYILQGDSALFNLNSEAFSLSRIPYYIILGLVCGFSSLYFTRGMNWIEDMFRKVKNIWVKFAIGGVILSALIFIFPPLYGEGYDSISALLNLNQSQIFEKSLFYGLQNSTIWLVAYLLMIILFKIFASAATNAAGGCGGIFAPSLFVGCFTGFLVAVILNVMGVDVPAQNFALAGMAGLMSGVMHAPLTGIFLIAELTGGYTLFIPLMIVSVISYITIYVFEPHSLYAMRLAKKGELMTHHKDKAVLSLLKTDDLIETDIQTIAPSAMFGDLIKLISQSKRNIFAVVDNKGVFLGIVSLEEVRNIMFRPELYNRFTVRRLMVSPPAKVYIGDSMETVARKFDDSHAWNLPVLDGDKYVGFVSKSKVFTAYRDVLVELSSE
ncbi:MAG: chloride channel protein [Paludibacteraceae bacterium]|jgi:CIC family chloride channel protein|nr:chloride channel protein [Paludibacteraceae bacterium]MDY6373880.1 chloride channel protein [Bacteroidales bacterium]